MVQSHSLAMQAISEEINKSANISPPDAELLVELTSNLNTCLQGLRGLQDCLNIVSLVKAS